MERLFKRIAKCEHTRSMSDIHGLHLLGNDLTDLAERPAYRAFRDRMPGDAWSTARALRLVGLILSLTGVRGKPTFASALVDPTGEASGLRHLPHLRMIRWWPSSNPTPSSMSGPASVYSLLVSTSLPAGGGAWMKVLLRADFDEDDWVYVHYSYSGRMTRFTSWPLARLRRFVFGLDHPEDHWMDRHYRCDGERGVCQLLEYLRLSAK